MQRSWAASGFSAPAAVPRLGGQSLFKIAKGDTAPSVDAAVSVEFEGETYSIPRRANQSMRVLSLVSQVIGLQKRSSGLPSVITIRAIP